MGKKFGLKTKWGYEAAGSFIQTQIVNLKRKEETIHKQKVQREIEML
jgi:hypothetical protein